ncbi:RNI-like protein [Piedraia hortae CBS 480.64]|uniref:RNI-like protein n=1 Tax=Piedraia hortae CBS 480.64 TaxID=1314780 RepID=A0A6A7C3F5_9PEZI|nr:RNI-like protein [Piedraia hortae CBS 480.64]
MAKAQDPQQQAQQQRQGNPKGGAPRSQRKQRPASSAGPFIPSTTPVREKAFAGSTFQHISPAPSSLPLPRFPRDPVPLDQPPAVTSPPEQNPTSTRPSIPQPNPTSSPPSRSRRPSLSARAASRRPPSVFGSLRQSVRSSCDDLRGDNLDHLYAASGNVPGEAEMEHQGAARTVLLHDEVQTSAGMFRKKREYLVLTETHLLRYKSQAKAADTFKSIPFPIGRSATVKHGSMPSVGSASDLQTMSDSSGDKDGRVPLRQVVAVTRLDDGKPYFAVELSYLDDESGQASSMALQFNQPDERDVWLRTLRRAVKDRLPDAAALTTCNIENAARMLERENDYDPANCAFFRVVQRQSAKSSGRSSTDDLAKVTSAVCYLVVGVHKVHLVRVVKAPLRSTSPSRAPHPSHASYGILTLTGALISGHDDSLELTFRAPLQRPKRLYLASSASHEIAARLDWAESYLRPECGQRLFRLVAPPEVEDFLPTAPQSDEEHGCLDRTLTAFCVAYGVNPAQVRYMIEYHCEDAPRFELLPRVDARKPDYGPVELMAIMRALRYNESFSTISFAGVSLDSLNGLHDMYGQEHVCTRTKQGTPIPLSMQELSRSCLLVQEVRALAATSKKLRRMDFSQCITAKSSPAVDAVDDDTTRPKDIGCGIVEALFPLCKHQTTNVDWICLNGIDLSDTDLDYLVGAAVEKSCHFRAIELNRCGLNDRSMGLILDALRAQDNTLEALELAGNTARFNPVTFDGQLGMFGFIRKLNLSYVSRTSGNEPLIQAETLLIWRLQELRLSGTTLNEATTDAVATFLAHPQSSSLQELYVDNTSLTGNGIATMLRSMCGDAHGERFLHLDISQNSLAKGLEAVAQAIAEGMAPTHLTMRAIEYREDSQFRKILVALAQNKTIRYIDMSQTALPGDASEETSRALERLLAENETITEMDLSGEDSRLATSKFGPGINQALMGLKHNKSLQIFRIEKQKLGLQGASTLAEVLKENTHLRELHCANNEIPLQGLTDLVNSLVANTSLCYLPTMDDGRAAAFKSAEMTMRGAESPPASPTPRSSMNGSLGGSVMRRGFASVRRTASRTTSAYTPSFPALPSYRSPSNSSGRLQRRLSSPLTRGLTTKSRQTPSTPVSASAMSFTVQDIQTTHRLLSEQWDRQIFRLGRYLERNWCVMNGVEVEMMIEDEKFERPTSLLDCDGYPP